SQLSVHAHTGIWWQFECVIHSFLPVYLTIVRHKLGESVMFALLAVYHYCHTNWT
uniref:Uncharacterized protein n=1 Tax=Aegilops tauschii subsp. strangulata TaxID=200361 RepID=A0A453SKE5_AEGTS